MLVGRGNMYSVYRPLLTSSRDTRSVSMDPVQFRIKNLPPQAPNAMWSAYLREGAAEFGWDKRHATGDKTAGPIKPGMGVAIGTWGGGGRGPAQAHCEIGADGSVIMRVGTQDLGTGTRTVLATVTADTLGLLGEAWHHDQEWHPHVFLVQEHRVAIVAVVLPERLTVVAGDHEQRLFVQTARS